MRPDLAGARWRAAALVPLAAMVGCAPPSGTSPSGTSPPARAGAELYNGNCVACHQQNAQGIPGVYPSLVGSKVVLGDPSAFALWVTRGRRPVSLPAGRYSTLMPQFGWMKPADLAALMSYLRTSFGNDAPAVEPAAIAAALGENPG
jgi:mono/diheme cytochrome c family protein